MTPLNIIPARIFKISMAVLAIVALLLGYNNYIIDRSIVNLNTALDEIRNVKSIEEAKRIEPFLKAVLIDEICQKRPNYYILAELESTLDILANPKESQQLEDLKFFLTKVIQIKKEKRPLLLYHLDRIIGYTSVSGLREIPISNLRAQADKISRSISSLRGSDKLQEASFDLGNIYIRLEEFAKAQEAFIKVIKFNPKGSLARQAKFNAAWVDKMQTEYDSSISNFNEFIQEYPGIEATICSQYQIGNIWQKKADFYKAIDTYQTITLEDLDSFFTELAQFQIGYLCLYDLKDYSRALEVFREIQAKTPSSRLAKYIEQNIIPRIAKHYRNLGFLLLSQKKYIEAIEQFSLALELVPNDGSCYTGEGLAYLWLGQKEKALEKAKKGKEISPNDYIVSVNLGLVYIYLGMLEEAITEYKRFISICPKSKEAHYNLGYTYTIIGDFNNAIAEFKRAIGIDPKFAFAYNNLGYILWYKEKYAEAMLEFKKAVQVKPDYSAAHFNLALALMIQGRYDEARREFETVLKLNPRDSVTAANLQELDRLAGNQ